MSGVSQGSPHAAIEDTGWSGPFDLLSRDECTTFLKATTAAPLPSWEKGFAVVSREFYDMAVRPELLSVVKEILGDDVVLWGAKVVAPQPGKSHRWHIDAQTILADGPTLDVWIGLENITTETSLYLMPGSQRFDKVAQELAQEIGQHGLTDEQAEQAARVWDPEAKIARPVMSEGQVLFFNGRVWHHSDNTSGKDRKALLLQYARADVAILRPEGPMDWPVVPGKLRPPCILVAGTAPPDVNVLVEPPSRSKGSSASPAAVSLSRRWVRRLFSVKTKMRLKKVLPVKELRRP